MAFFYRENSNKESSYFYLEKLLHREYKQKLQLMIGLIIFCILLLCTNFIYVPQIELIHLTEIIVLLISIGIIFLGRDLFNTRKMQRHPIYKTLMRTPKDIVWIYTINYEMASFGVYLFTRSSLVFNTLDRKQYILYGPSQDVKLAKRALANMLPHATFGFSKELEQLYTASPLLLWNENIPLPDIDDKDLDN